MSRSDLERLQIDRLRALLAEVIPANAFLTRKFAAAGVAPEFGTPAVGGAFRIESPADLARFPFTTKAELLEDQQAHPPYGTNLTYPAERYFRLHQTSGSTGHPLRWLDTPASWEWVMRCWAQLFSLMELTPADRLFFAFSFGPFLGFWAGFEGANRLGNFCLAGGGLSSQSRLKLIFENRMTIVCCTPTYALRLAEVAREEGLDLRTSGVRGLLVAGEAGGNIPATRRRIEEEWGARVIDHWGMTELGPMAIEAPSRAGGLYFLETESIVEIIDFATNAPVAAGQEGELVVTNLGRYGSPLIRYRTGDRVRIGPAVEETALLWLEGGILGRVDEMLTIRGNNIYPSALEEILRSADGLAEYRIEVRTQKGMQHVKVEVEPVPQLDEPAVAALVRGVANAIRIRWNFQAEVVAVLPGALPRFELKGRRLSIRKDEG